MATVEGAFTTGSGSIRWQRIAKEVELEIAVSDDQNVTVLERFRHVDWENYRFDQCNTRLDPIGPFYPMDVYAALKNSFGNYGKAAVLLGRPRDSLMRWLKANPEFNQIAIDTEETVLDDVEDIVKKQALEGDGAQARFLLSTKAKNRGYSTKVENGGRIGIELEFSRIVENRLTEEQILRMAEEIVARQVEQSNTIEGTVEHATED